MKKFTIEYHKQIGFAVLTFLLILVSIVTFVTDNSRDKTNEATLLQFLVNHHTTIMFFLIIVAISFGFYWSNLSYVQFVKQKKSSEQMLHVIMMFLSKEEKEIITHLVSRNGNSNQAEIARLNGMNNVKAFRSVQKMQEKGLVDVTAHGKLRNIFLKENIKELLDD